MGCVGWGFRPAMQRHRQEVELLETEAKRGEWEEAEKSGETSRGSPQRGNWRDGISESREACFSGSSLGLVAFSICLAFGACVWSLGSYGVLISGSLLGSDLSVRSLRGSCRVRRSRFICVTGDSGWDRLGLVQLDVCEGRGGLGSLYEERPLPWMRGRTMGGFRGERIGEAKVLGP